MNLLESDMYEKLLGRNEKLLYVEQEFWRDKVVLVTGAGGTIGRAIVDKLSGIPKLIIALDRNEEKLFWLSHEIRGIECALKDFKDLTLRELRDVNVDIVIHCAAYKHVPFLEAKEEAAIRNNVGATANLAGMCYTAGIHFVQISTDKTVAPKSIMGKTKWVAERIIDSWRKLGMKTTILRMANIIGASGSVLHIWKHQYDNEGKIFVTDRSMKRWFITEDEAATHIIRAIELTNDKDYLFAIKPERETKIVDLAERWLEFCYGDYAKYEDGSYRIMYSGAMSGEKISEDFIYSDQELIHIVGLLHVIHRKGDGNGMENVILQPVQCILSTDDI